MHKIGTMLMDSIKLSCADAGVHAVNCHNGMISFVVVSGISANIVRDCFCLCSVFRCTLLCSRVWRLFVYEVTTSCYKVYHRIVVAIPTSI